MTLKKSREEWKEVLEKWKSSGKNIADFCQETGVSHWGLRYWKNKLCSEHQGQPLVQIKPDIPKKPSLHGLIEVELRSQILVRLPMATGPQYLATLIRELQK